MTIEREEGEWATIMLDGMLQDDRRPIIKRQVVVAKTVDNAIQRGIDCRAFIHEQVEAEVDGTPLRTIVALGAVLLTGVDCASLVVAAYAHGRMRGPQAREQRMRQCFWLRPIRRAAIPRREQQWSSVANHPPR